MCNKLFYNNLLKIELQTAKTVLKMLTKRINRFWKQNNKWKGKRSGLFVVVLTVNFVLRFLMYVFITVNIFINITAVNSFITLPLTAGVNAVQKNDMHCKLWLAARCLCFWYSGWFHVAETPTGKKILWNINYIRMRRKIIDDYRL